MTERWPRPLLIDPSGTQLLLEASPAGQPPFNETELQRILAAHPELLPVAQFDPLFGPPSCIGREISTGAGPLDLLYVSPSGHLTLVETKLWKSPEARRQVVGQIIDYTRHLVRWDFGKLNAAFSQYAKQAGIEQQTLVAYMAEQCDDDLDEAAFTDAVGRSLRLGRLLLLIVGDGIREGVEEMTAYLQDVPNLQFTLGLVELGCYRVGSGARDGSTLLVPRIVMRTAEVTRAIVQIEMTEEAARRVSVTTATPTAVAGEIRTTLSKTEFYQILQGGVGLEIANQLRGAIDRLLATHENLEEDFTRKKLSLRAVLPNADVALPVMYFGTNGAVTVYRWLADGLREHGVPTTVVQGFLDGLQGIDRKFPRQIEGNGQVRGFKSVERNANLANVLPKFADLEQLLVQLLQDVDRYARETP